MAEITMDTDWGAKGAQLTGAQVQAFIKEQLTELHEQCQTNKDATKAQAEQLKAVTDGCRILYATYDELLLCNPWEWPQISKETEAYAVGVQVNIDGIGSFIVAPTESEYYMPWAKVTNVLVNPGNQDIRSIIANFNGDILTVEILAKSSTLFPEGEQNYPVGFCYHYSRTHYFKEGECENGLGVKRWHLPSIGELWSIYCHHAAINAALSVIDGSVPLPKNGLYWSSTEFSDSNAWCIDFKYGYPGNPSKIKKGWVRPVAAFH